MAMNEADTRANLIDPKLVDAGWGQVELSFIRREVNITQGRIIGGITNTALQTLGIVFRLAHAFGVAKAFFFCFYSS